MNFILIAVIVLGGIALIAALVLFVCSKRFAVYEDPRISQVNELLGRLFQASTTDYFYED